MNPTLIHKFGKLSKLPFLNNPEAKSKNINNFQTKTTDEEDIKMFRKIISKSVTIGFLDYNLEKEINGANNKTPNKLDNELNDVISESDYSQNDEVNVADNKVINLGEQEENYTISTNEKVNINESENDKSEILKVESSDVVEGSPTIVKLFKRMNGKSKLNKDKKIVKLQTISNKPSSDMLNFMRTTITNKLVDFKNEIKDFRKEWLGHQFHPEKIEQYKGIFNNYWIVMKAKRKFLDLLKKAKFKTMFKFKDKFIK